MNSINNAITLIDFVDTCDGRCDISLIHFHILYILAISGQVAVRNCYYGFL